MAAWTEALISENPNAKVDVRVLEQITEQLITNDCRVIEESLEIIASTSNPDTRTSRERLVQDRLTHLRKLIPYTDKKQTKEIQRTEIEMHQNVIEMFRNVIEMLRNIIAMFRNVWYILVIEWWGCQDENIGIIPRRIIGRSGLRMYYCKKSCQRLKRL